jgi:methylphosphotriester-DNA--protein-cysteine methyltransferase
MKVFANKKTKIVHADGKRGDACRRSLMLKKNVVRFNSLEDPRLAGYRVCKKCKPEY